MNINIRVIFSIRLHSQEAPTPMIDALTRLIIDMSEVTPAGIVMRAINPWRHYKRWCDKKSTSFPIR